MGTPAGDVDFGGVLVEEVAVSLNPCPLADPMPMG